MPTIKAMHTIFGGKARASTKQFCIIGLYTKSGERVDFIINASPRRSLTGEVERARERDRERKIEREQPPRRSLAGEVERERGRERDR